MQDRSIKQIFSQINTQQLHSKKDDTQDKKPEKQSYNNDSQCYPDYYGNELNRMNESEEEELQEQINQSNAKNNSDYDPADNLQDDEYNKPEESFKVKVIDSTEQQPSSHL